MAMEQPSTSRPECPLLPALAAGLRSDLAAFRPRSITREAFKEAQRSDKRIRENDITAMFGIYNNSLFWLQPDVHPLPRNPQLYAIADDLRALLGLHRVPDVEFLLNVDDYPKAQGKARGVPVPLFSFTKRETTDAGTGRTSSPDFDVLVPSGAFRMSFMDAKLAGRLAGAPGSPAAWEAQFPWAAKQGKAYFRGTPYCGIHRFGRCSRYVIPRLAHEGRAPLLDVGLVEYEPSHDTERRDHPSYAPLTKARREPEAALARYKYLLHLDGHSFSSRLQHLLLTNAAVLKQQSMYVEYYYRALQPWQHCATDEIQPAPLAARHRTNNPDACRSPPCLASDVLHTCVSASCACRYPVLCDGTRRHHRGAAECEPAR